MGTLARASSQLPPSWSPDSRSIAYQSTGRIYGLAGNDTIRARNGHHDTVDCGAGRGTVYAARGDSLAHCEIVRR